MDATRYLIVSGLNVASTEPDEMWDDYEHDTGRSVVTGY